MLFYSVKNSNFICIWSFLLASRIQMISVSWQLPSSITTTYPNALFSGWKKTFPEFLFIPSFYLTLDSYLVSIFCILFLHSNLQKLHSTLINYIWYSFNFIFLRTVDYFVLKRDWREVRIWSFAQKIEFLIKPHGMLNQKSLKQKLKKQLTYMISTLVLFNIMKTRDLESLKNTYQNVQLHFLKVYSSSIQMSYNHEKMVAESKTLFTILEEIRK